MRKGKKEFYEHAKEKEKELKEGLEKEEKLGAKDIFAMLFSAFAVFLPICLGVLILLGLLVLLLFGVL